MAGGAVVVDLTKQSEFTEFSGSSEEDINYAKTFWQSIKLHPPMESRLVSSDIKQRLRIAPASSQTRNLAHSIPEEPPVLHEFLVRAKTIEQLENFSRLQLFAEAKEDSKELLQKRKEERKKKEEISRNKGVKPLRKQQANDENVLLQEEYTNEFEHEDPKAVLKQLDDFESSKFGQKDNDSDQE